MKTLLAIVLAAAVAATVLISGGTVSQMSGAASARSALAQRWCTKGCPPPPKPAPTDQLAVDKPR